MASSCAGVATPSGDAVVIAEVELGKVAVQVGFADGWKVPIDAALQDREKAFDRVGVRRRRHVLAASVIDRLWRGELRAEGG